MIASLVEAVYGVEEADGGVRLGMDWLPTRQLKAAVEAAGAEQQLLCEEGVGEVAASQLSLQQPRQPG